MNNSHIKQTLFLRKEMLHAKLGETRSLIKQDLNDLKNDLNPLKTAGHFIKNLLNPAAKAQDSDSNLLNFGVDAGIGMLVNRFVPGTHNNTVRTIAPVLLRNLAAFTMPKARQTAEKFLHWVAEKTEKKPEHVLLNGEVETKGTALSG